MVPKILVVEDEPLIRFALVLHLEGHGFHVIEAENGEVGISCLLDTADIAMVFTDICMPGSVDGVKLARWMQEHRPNVPFLITSGEMGAHRELKATFQQQFIEKPYTLESVTDRILAMLSVPS